MPHIFKMPMSLKFLQQSLQLKGLYTGQIDGRYGPMTKKAIISLQKVLHGYNVFWSKYTGIYDEQTQEAVARWQQLHPPLIPDGIIGPKTMEALIPSHIADREDIRESHNTYRSQATGRHYPHESRAAEYYGHPGRNQTRILLPYKVKIAWNTDKKINRITCHKLIAEDLQGVYEETLKEYGLDGIQQLGLDLWGGVLNVRRIRGGTRYSMHAYGIAEDIDPAHNQLRWHTPKARLSGLEYQRYWEICEYHGAYSLGRERNYDWMHKQWAHR